MCWPETKGGQKPEGSFQLWAVIKGGEFVVGERRFKNAALLFLASRLPCEKIRWRLALLFFWNFISFFFLFCSVHQWGHQIISSSVSATASHCGDLRRFSLRSSRSLGLWTFQILPTGWLVPTEISRKRPIMSTVISGDSPDTEESIDLSELSL